MCTHNIICTAARTHARANSHARAHVRACTRVDTSSSLAHIRADAPMSRHACTLTRERYWATVEDKNSRIIANRVVDRQINLFTLFWWWQYRTVLLAYMTILNCPYSPFRATMQFIYENNARGLGEANKWFYNKWWAIIAFYLDKFIQIVTFVTIECIYCLSELAIMLLKCVPYNCNYVRL